MATAIPHALLVVADDGRVTAWNPAAEALIGSPAGRSLADLGIERSDGIIELQGRAARHVRRSIAPLPDGGAVVTLTDVSDEQELRRLAERDDLTGLPNRRRFLEILARHLDSRRREDTTGALLLLDLDHFKALNDTFGHTAGDRLLALVATAIAERLRRGDVLARLGGDEFAVLLPHARDDEAHGVAAALVERLRHVPMPAGHGGTRPVSASVGVTALGGPATSTAERALGRADAAMYRAKAEGRGAWRSEAASRPGIGAQLAKRSQQLAVANALGARLAGMSDAGAIAEAIVEELRRAFGYHLCAVLQIRPDDHVEAIAVRGTHFDALKLRGWSQPRDAGLIGRCLHERMPILVNDVAADAGYQETPETLDVRAELVVPLLVDGTVWGAINLEELEAHAFDGDDVILLSTLANQVAAALRAGALLERISALEALASRSAVADYDPLVTAMSAGST